VDDLALSILVIGAVVDRHLVVDITGQRRSYRTSVWIRSASKTLSDNDWKFLSFVCKATRSAFSAAAQAIEKYRAALAVPGTPQIRHDQYKMKIDETRVEGRLKTPFTRWRVRA
jgi:hypothetical protein